MSFHYSNALGAMEGDHVVVKRLMPVAGLRNHDPFVLFDHFRLTSGSGFPEHPHRGFEALTYLFSGTMLHADNLGNNSTITAGGVQRFTAGKGIVHSEMPGGDATSEGIQLWINLPQRLKQVEPGYQQVSKQELPVSESGGVRVCSIVGGDSPVRLLTPALYQDIQIAAGSRYVMDTPIGYNGFIYVVGGEIDVAGNRLINAGALLFKNEPAIELIAMQDSRLLFCCGAPHGEAIHQHGPFVD